MHNRHDSRRSHVPQEPAAVAPWKKRDYSQHAMIALHQEIEDFVAFVEPLPAELTLRQEIVAQLSDVVHGIWPAAEVRWIGQSPSETRCMLCSA